MTLLSRPSRPLARRARVARDDRLFVVATEDTYAPHQYFSGFRIPRVQVHVVPTTDGKSAASDVVERLKELRDDAARRGDLQASDQFWVVVDTDHYVSGRHVKSFKSALKVARSLQFNVAVSNPCFEIWLLLHVSSPPAELKNARAVVDALRNALGSYDKSNIDMEQYLPGVQDAVVRAKTLDVGLAGWPQKMGTQVHLLVEEIMST